MHILAVLQGLQRPTNSHVFDDTSIWMKVIQHLTIIIYVGFYANWLLPCSPPLLLPLRHSSQNASDIRLENKGMDREKARKHSFGVYKYNIKHTSHREHVETLPTQPPG